MRGRAAVLALCSILLPGSLSAQNATVDIPAAALNHLVSRLGSPSDAGIFVPGGTAPQSSPLPWQWWITDAHFNLEAGARPFAPGVMTFTATVQSRVGDQTSSQTHTAPASINFDPSSNRLRISITRFTVLMQADGVTVTEVDVAKLYGLAVPVEPQSATLPLPGGGTRSVTARVTAVSTQVEAGRLVLIVSVGF